MTANTATTSYTKRFSYAASDTAGQLVFCVISFYLLKFYTDVYGLSAAAAGTILLVARCVDAADAPVWGVIFDKTHSRWGKSRPWFLWLSAPFATFGVLTFVAPNLGYTGKVIYAATTYIACSVLYTGINTPVTSILSALTGDPRERVTLTCFRMFGSKLGVLLVNLTALKLVAVLGHGDDRRGFMLVLPIYATGTLMLYLTAFWNLVETVKEEKKSLPIRDSLRAMRGNWPWMIVFASSLCFWIAFIARISTAPYFFEYVLQRPDLIGLANGLDFISLATVFFLPFLCRWTSKRNVWMSGLLGMVVGQIIVYFGVRQKMSLGIILGGWAFGFLASGAAMAMLFSLISDCVDYGEWKTGIRAAGFLTAIGAAFCLKAGSGIGGALPAWILAAGGYVPNVTQTAASLNSIEISFIWLPAAFFAVSILPVLFYKGFEKLEPQIHSDLQNRRKRARIVDGHDGRRQCSSAG
ncbi:MAG: glycoside-pentoside-hexuronide (GPH):cation symporter [Verrucomicrobiota bacterium]|nr:glycoside-pentoside-hexuronide (GPH):cation symporter [Verrucomicrobiota bacterium]